MSIGSDAAISVAPDAVEDRAARGDLSVFLATSATKDPLQTYRDSLQSIRAAEALGYSYAWVAEAHFRSIIALPVALVFLAAATQISDRIRLGTAVVPLAFDTPLRLAETAALVNALSGERLEFGVGKGNARGFSTDAYNAFGLDEGDRDELFVRALEALKTALREPIALGEKEVTIYPLRAGCSTASGRPPGIARPQPQPARRVTGYCCSAQFWKAPPARRSPCWLTATWMRSRAPAPAAGPGSVSRDHS